MSSSKSSKSSSTPRVCNGKNRKRGSSAGIMLEVIAPPESKSTEASSNQRKPAIDTDTATSVKNVKAPISYVPSDTELYQPAGFTSVVWHAFRASCRYSRSVGVLDV